jgi:hypothetical protein
MAMDQAIQYFRPKEVPIAEPLPAFPHFIDATAFPKKSHTIQLAIRV